MIPSSGIFTVEVCGFKIGGVTFFFGAGVFFPLLDGVLPFGGALEPAFAAALAPGTKSEMMINYEQASKKSIIILFSLCYKHNVIHLIIPAPNLAPSWASAACASLPSCFRISLMREKKYKTLIFNSSIMSD